LALNSKDISSSIEEYRKNLSHSVIKKREKLKIK